MNGSHTCLRNVVRKFSCLLCAFILCGMSARISAAQGNQPPGKPYVYKQVDGRELFLWVTEPQDVASADASPLRAAVVLFHGGGWTGGRPAQMAPQVTSIARHGAVGITVQYRFIPDRNQEPRICVEDTKSAMRWVRAHARMLRIDPSRIAIGGASAGGYDAAYAAMAPGWDAPDDDLSISPRGNAILLWNPVIDTSEKGYSHESFGDDAANRSPMTYLNASVSPILIQSGTKDIHINIDVLHTFAEKAKSLGVRCDLIPYDGQSHGFFNREPFLSQTNDAMINFLASLGYVHL